MTTPARLTAEIRLRARDLGFDLVGITSADPPDHAADFEDWIEAGMHGERGYLARRRAERVDLQQVLPGARSVVVVGLNYLGAEIPAAEAGPRIARYAQGTGDYHDVIGEKLDQLADVIRGLQPSNPPVRCYVDTGPVLERDLAERAGIGFVGKHTNLISRDRGNWIFLGEILTTLELEPDLPATKHCGTCTRCIDACPTRAITAPYQLDARLCISYLTIELKGSIPVELRPLIGDRVFGCDDCLEVCPWNRFAQASPVKEFQPRTDLPALTEFLAWDDARFREFFRGTPIHRLKRRGWLRNVCVALGNLGDRSALPALRRALDDAEPLVREHAAWAVDRITSSNS